MLGAVTRKLTAGLAAGLLVCLAATQSLSSDQGERRGARRAEAGETGLTPGASDVVRLEAHAASGAISWVAEAALRRTAVGAGLSRDVLALALDAVGCAVRSGDIAPPPTLTVIDYSRPSVEPRLWVFATDTGNLLFRELVAHGRNTGENMASRFSDAVNSRQSSVGLFVTADTYVGSNGYSLRLDGLEPGFNAHARERAIVMHGAEYVDAELATRQGRLGRSWGCPALREAVAHDVIDTIRGGGVIFSYYPDRAWLRTSRYLTGCRRPDAVLATH